MKHGASAYRDVNTRCRCEVCTEDHRQRHQREQRARAARLAADPSLAKHGSKHTYVNWGCRCPACTAANADGCRRYRQRRREAIDAGFGSV